MVRTFRDWMWRVHLMMSVKNVYPFITVANLNCRTLLLGIPFLLLLFQVLLTLRERTQAINLPIHLVDLPVLLPIRLPPLIMMCLLKYFKTPTSYSQFRRRFRFVLQSLCYPDSIGCQVFILHRRFRRPIPPVSFLRLNICTHRVYHEVSLRPRVFRIRATHPYRWLLACHPVYRLHLFLLRMHHLSPLHHHHTTPYPPLPANLNAHAKHPNPLPFLPSFPVPTLNSTTGEIPLVCILLLSHLDYRERCDTIQRILSVQSDKRLPSVIQNAMVSWDFDAGNTVLFLSTDSTYTEKYIRKRLGKDYTIVTTNSFYRGHTGRSNSVAVQRALIDLHLLADSDALLIGMGSGFGRVAKLMGRSPRVIEYFVHHRFIEGFDARKGHFRRSLYVCLYV